MEGRLLTINPTEKQYLAWQALQNPDIAEIHFGGAAGGGKTWLGAESRLVRALAYPGYKSCIGRNELTRLKATSLLTFIKVCNFHGIGSDEYKINNQYNFIEFSNGSRIDLLDLSFGESFTSVIQDVIAHLINHSTYHRAQVAKELRVLGISPPNTDYITYCRLLEAGSIKDQF